MLCWIEWVRVRLLALPSDSLHTHLESATPLPGRKLPADIPIYKPAIRHWVRYLNPLQSHVSFTHIPYGNPESQACSKS